MGASKLEVRLAYQRYAKSEDTELATGLGVADHYKGLPMMDRVEESRQ